MCAADKAGLKPAVGLGVASSGFLGRLGLCVPPPTRIKAELRPFIVSAPQRQPFPPSMRTHSSQMKITFNSLMVRPGAPAAAGGAAGAPGPGMAETCRYVPHILLLIWDQCLTAAPLLCFSVQCN